MQAMMKALRQFDAKMKAEEERPINIISFVSASIARENAEVIGMKIRPKFSVKIFQQLGFQENDLIVEVNGEPINTTVSVMNAYRELQSSTSAKIKIIRDDERMDIAVNIADVAKEHLPPKVFSPKEVLETLF